MHSSDVVVVKASELKQFCTEVFESLGLPHEDAGIIGDVLVETDLRGVFTHGVALFKDYFLALKTREVNPRPNIRTVTELPSLALMDGDRGMGQVAAVKAMERCIEKAKETGMCAVGVRNSCHFGMAAYYAMLALPHDMIGFATTNTEPILAPYGGVEPATGNNPQAYAIPAGKERPIVIDMAQSVVAAGKIGLAARLGQSIPAGWAIDEDGESLTDPAQALQMLRLAPMGGPKGYALAVVMETLSGVLTGAKFGRALQLGGHVVDQEIGHFFWALDIAGFMPVEDFKQRVDDLARQLKEVRPARGVDRVLVPGELELAAHDRYTQEGIPIKPEIVEDLKAIATEQHLATLFDSTFKK